MSPEQKIECEYKNAVFIHIPRTAGRYISIALGLERYIYRTRMKTLFNQSGLINIGHQDYRMLLKNGIIGKEFDKTSFKFTFCRNPFDRLISHYAYARQKHPDILPKDVSFEYFVQNLKTYNVPRNYNRKRLQKKTFRPQIKSIGGVKMDFIGRFENLSEDVQKVADILNIQVNDVMPIGKTKHKPYQEYYTEELEQKVREFYERDFNAFGYDNHILH